MARGRVQSCPNGFGRFETNVARKDIVYVDGFSGPWESKAEDFRDSSFMIAIQVLRDAQQKMSQLTGTRRGVRCFLAERNQEAYALLQAATTPYNVPGEAFEIKTYRGEFEEAVGEIDAFIANSFPLIFIDPTGWAGYSLEKIRPLFRRRKCEVLINFMYDFINPFRLKRRARHRSLAGADPGRRGLARAARPRASARIGGGEAVQRVASRRRPVRIRRFDSHCQINS